MDVANLLTLLQDLGFSNEYIVIFALVSIILATIYTASVIIGQWLINKGQSLINKGLELDNQKKKLDNDLRKKQLIQPNKTSEQDAGTTCTKANLNTEK